MSLLDVIMAAEAAETGKAVRRTAFRHVHLTDRPFVVVAYNLSGEAAAPLGIMYGTDPDLGSASLVVAAEPRNRESRFSAINAFGEDFAGYVRPYLLLETVRKKDGSFRQQAGDTPQVIVPNRSTRNYLGARLGRSLRYLGLGETHEVPDTTLWTGSHLSWLAEHSHLPGQSVFLAMTETLSQHFATGQSGLEDENLATLLAWIDGLPADPLPVLEGLEERAYGPVPHPRWEARLEPFVKAYTDGLRASDDEATRKAFESVEAMVREALAPAYADTHKAIGIMREIEPAESVSLRWKWDGAEWSSHARRALFGIPRFARRHDAVRAARALQRWSRAAEELETQKAFDDPLIMAHLDAAGRCLSGIVGAIDGENREVKPGNKNRTRVPLIDVTLDGPTRLLQGEIVRWTADRRVRCAVRQVEGASATVAVIDGVRALDKSGLTEGDLVFFAGLDPWGGTDPRAPDEVPWTHSASTSELGGDLTEDPGAGNSDDSPDLTLQELGELAVVGVVGPDDEPGVLQ